MKLSERGNMEEQVTTMQGFGRHVDGTWRGNKGVSLRSHVVEWLTKNIQYINYRIRKQAR